MSSKLEQSLQSGFIDQKLPAFGEYLPQFLVNDKNEGKKILTTILQELNNCEEFWFSVAFVTTNGVATLIQSLIDLEKKGVKGKILVSQYLNFTQPEALRRLLQFKNLEVKIAIDNSFHSKGYLFKKKDVYDLIIGSSNLTATALCSNIEWNLKITATPVSHIIFNAIKEFTSEYEKATAVDEVFLTQYETLYKKQIDYSRLLKKELVATSVKEIKPNLMQIEALKNIEHLRSQGKQKALLISATGTGKTYLSAFDAKAFNPKKLLFVVHRLNIANASKLAYETIFGGSKSMGIYSGSQKDLDADFIFCTIQTLAKDENLKQFASDHFDYIIIDETHRAGADSYQKILGHFNPKFLLGMTATPERTDGYDIFKSFDYNIAYEIRLHRALEEDILSPFHYYGVTDISVDGIVLEEKSDFKLLASQERIERIIEKSKVFGCDNGIVRGLIFCSKVEESKALSEAFNERGFKTIALSGETNESEREAAILKLELDNKELDYIFTVDIFNEGIDIPKVNQIILLRPTQSAIIFVQQLGRGLRKADDKHYLTVIDFIGNYSNNFLVPIALYGDTSYNKDSLRKLMASGSSLIPGTSTINFDQISREKIFKAIDTANLQQKKDLINDYKLLKYRIGRIPMMVDFIEQNGRDPQLFVKYSRSYFNFVASQEDDLKTKLSPSHILLLELFSNEIANAKRIEEVVIVKLLIEKETISTSELKQFIQDKYEIALSDKTIISCIQNLNFEFIAKPKNVVVLENDRFEFHTEFSDLLKNAEFKTYFIDLLKYAELKYDSHFSKGKYVDGFILYQKYSRKDVCRLLNWDRNEESTMFGYKLKHHTCPIFVNYHKEENIAASTKFDDRFINKNKFQWFTKPRRYLDSQEVIAINNYLNGLKLPLFIKKSNGESDDFYYMGDVTPIEDSFKETSLIDDHGKKVSVVKIDYSMNHPVEDAIYEYLTTTIEEEKEVKEKTEAKSSEEKMPFKILSLDAVVPFTNCIPLYTLEAAAGDFKIHDKIEEVKWVTLNEEFKYSKDYFVFQVNGESMNKIIPNGSYCLFKNDPGGSRNGKIVLVKSREINDTEMGYGYTVKLYESVKKESGEIWEHETIILKPRSTDPKYKDIVLTIDEETPVEIRGIFVKVLK